jgi:hypothetical protein
MLEENELGKEEYNAYQEHGRSERSMNYTEIEDIALAKACESVNSSTIVPKTQVPFGFPF